METKALPTAQEDLASICASVAANRPVDPVDAWRVQEQWAKIIQSMKETSGLAVQLIRESREETCE